MLGIAIAGASVLVGIATLFFAVLAWLSSRRSEQVGKRALEVSEEQLRLTREQGEVQLKVWQEAYWGADNKERLPRFTIHNVGLRVVNVQDVLVDTLPEKEGPSEKKMRTLMCSMGRESGREPPGRLRPGDHVLLDAHEGAKILQKQGFSGKVETNLIVRDAVEKEVRYPITLHVEGKDNLGEFDLILD